jgi:uncharacterized protein HemX
MSKSNPPKNGVQIYVPPKLAIVAIAIVIGSGAGGFGVSNLFNGSGTEEKGHRSDRKHRDREFNVRFKSIEATQTKHTEKIEELEETTGEIQSVQHKNIARTEARRVTESIINKRRRREIEDRIYEINLTRLKDKKSPCLDRTCAN